MTPFSKKPAIHKIPAADYIEHETTDNCICGPDIITNAQGKAVIHHSLDGREKRQRGSTTGSADSTAD